MQGALRPLGLMCALVLVWAGTGGAQAVDPDAVLAAMRIALGGDATLTSVQTMSARGSVTETHAGRSRSLSVEIFALRPDQFMTVRRDSQSAGPMPIDITYYSGFRGDRVIRRTDSNIPFPPDPTPQTPQAIADRQMRGLMLARQEFARLSLVLFGGWTSSYPLTFSLLGTAKVDDRSGNVVEARGVDGFVIKLVVDAATNLPLAIEWQAPPVVVTSTTSTVAVRAPVSGAGRGGAVPMGPGTIVGASPPPPLPAGDPTAGLPLVTKRQTFSDFKVEGGLNWPRRFRTMIGTDIGEDMRIGSYQINPKFDAKKFDVER